MVLVHVVVGEVIMLLGMCGNAAIPILAGREYTEQDDSSLVYLLLFTWCCLRLLLFTVFHQYPLMIAEFGYFWMSLATSSIAVERFLVSRNTRFHDEQSASTLTVTTICFAMHVREDI